MRSYTTYDEKRQSIIINTIKNSGLHHWAVIDNKILLTTIPGVILLVFISKKDFQYCIKNTVPKFQPIWAVNISNNTDLAACNKWLKRCKLAEEFPNIQIINQTVNPMNANKKQDVTGNTAASTNSP